MSEPVLLLSFVGKLRIIVVQILSKEGERTIDGEVRDQHFLIQYALSTVFLGLHT